MFKDMISSVGELKHALEGFAEDTPVIFEHLTDEQYVDDSGPDFEYTIDDLFFDPETKTLRLLSVGLTDELAEEEEDIDTAIQNLFQEASRND